LLFLLTYILRKIIPSNWSTGYYFRYPFKIFCYFYWLIYYGRLFPPTEVRDIILDILLRYFVIFIGLCITEDYSFQLKNGIIFSISFKIFCYFYWLIYYGRLFPPTEVRDIILDIILRYFVIFIGLCITEDYSFQLKNGIIFSISFKIFCYFYWLVYYGRLFPPTEVRDIIFDILKIFCYFYWLMHYGRLFLSTEERDNIFSII